MKENRIVYSTESGRICPSCQKPVSACRCKKKNPQHRKAVKVDGTIRIQREVKGRKGKTATVIYGFELDNGKLKQLARELKRRCGTGGSVKGGQVIIQGDHRNTLLTELKKRGFKVKIAGG